MGAVATKEHIFAHGHPSTLEGIEQPSKTGIMSAATKLRVLPPFAACAYRLCQLQGDAKFTPHGYPL